MSTAAAEAYTALALHGTPPSADAAAELREHHLLSPQSGSPVPIRLATAAWAASRRVRLAALEDAAEHIDQQEARDRRSGSFIEVLDGLDQVGTAYEQLQRSAQEYVRAFDRPPYLSAGPVEISSAQPETIGRGVMYRTVYLSTNLHRDSLRRAIKSAVDMGEKARLHDDLPVRMVLADESLGMVILPQPDDSMRPTVERRVDALLVYPSALLTALSDLFESTWARALPIDLSDELDAPGAADHIDRRILTYMSSGLTDARIATALGVSERTVARRISRLQDRLGAPSRFLLGVRAARDRLV